MNAKLLIRDQVFVPGDLVTFTTSDPHQPRVTIRGIVKPGEHLQGQTRVVPVQFGRSKGATFVSLYETFGLPYMHVTRRIVKWEERGETLAGELIEQSGRLLTVSRCGQYHVLDRTRALVLDPREWLKIVLSLDDRIDVEHAVRAVHVLYPKADIIRVARGGHQIVSPGFNRRIPLSAVCTHPRRAWLAAWKSIRTRSKLSCTEL